MSLNAETKGILYGLGEFLAGLLMELFKGLRTGRVQDMPRVQNYIPDGQPLGADELADRLKEDARRYFEG